MALFLEFKFLIALKLNFNGDQFINKYQNLVISKSGKKVIFKLLSLKLKILSICVLKFEVDNFFEHLRSNTRVNKNYIEVDNFEHLRSRAKKSGAGWVDEWEDGWVVEPG